MRGIGLSVLNFLQYPFSRLIEFKGFIFESVVIEITIRYRGSFFGVLWSVLNPVLQATVIYVVFRQVFRIETLGDREYFPYIYSGILLAHFFTQTILLAGEQIFAKSGLLIQSRVPLEVFVATTIIVNTVNFIFGLIPLMFYLIFSQATFTLGVLIFPLLILTIWGWVCSLGLLLNSLYVRFVDLRFLLPVLASLLIYLTPVYYDLSTMVGLSRRIIQLNPLTFILSDFRFVLGMESTFNLKASFLIMITGLVGVPVMSNFGRKNKKLIWALQ